MFTNYLRSCVISHGLITNFLYIKPYRSNIYHLHDMKPSCILQLKSKQPIRIYM
uniref:Uncharacterized protein n=1 Tax=Rhizophora mucronata TaxID=61149 RepID=A0A2P2NRG6_RHIMU